MGRFTKKPVTIDAVRFRSADPPYDKFIREAIGRHELSYLADGTAMINTPEGTMIAQDGDWIIRGVEGEIYPCKDSVFQATYAPASRTPDATGAPVLTLAETMVVVETKTAPRVTEASIKAKIQDVEYFRARHLTICIITLTNGFFVEGHSAPAAVENYDQAVGERYAYENAFRQIWPLEGYLLRDRLAASAAERRGQGNAGEAAHPGARQNTGHRGEPRA